MPKKRSTRIYQRGGRYWGDFRDYSDVGGTREPLKAPRTKLATDDEDVALRLATDRVAQLEEKRRGRGLGQEERQSLPLKVYAAAHLERKAEDGEATARWLTSMQKHLAAASEFFGETTELDTIQPTDLNRWVAHLRRQSNGRGEKLSDTTVRKYLNSLSNLYARALSDHPATVKSNPVSAMYSKPTGEAEEARYLEPEEVALLLESARTYRPTVEPVRQKHGGAISPKANAHVYPFIATLALTGARFTEAAGLLVDDVSFRLGKVYIRPNDYRRLKTKGSKRTVPLWPQLREILEAYLLERERSGGVGTLLFPGRSPKDKEIMVADVRKALDAIATRAGFELGSVRPHGLRHTYTAARIQTCDRGRPVALYTVARELGHSSLDMISDRYGHLHDRAEEGGAEEVGFRVEQYREKLGDRLEALHQMA